MRMDINPLLKFHVAVVWLWHCGFVQARVVCFCSIADDCMFEFQLVFDPFTP